MSQQSEQPPAAPRQRLRWRRGLFRTWLILSALWVIGMVVLLAADMNYRPLASDETFFYYPADGTVSRMDLWNRVDGCGDNFQGYELDVSTHPIDQVAATTITVCDALNGSWRDSLNKKDQMKAEIASIRAAVMAHDSEELQRASAKAIAYALVAFGVPLVVLAFGLCVGWAVSGFRP